MLGRQWQNVAMPMYGWATTLEKIFSRIDLPAFDGPTVNIFSDYSGQHRRSRYEAISALYLDLAASAKWEKRRRYVRDRGLPDGRRMSFKCLNDRLRRKALVPFLEAADDIVGLLVTVIISKSIRELCVSAVDLERARSSLGLHRRWTAPRLEQALRVAHLIGLLIGGLSRPDQNIYWISDEDTLFANAKQTKELGRIVGKITALYAPHQLGQLGLCTTSIDPGDRYEEDTAAVADLAAGGMAEAANTIALKAGGRIPAHVAVPSGGRFSSKSNLISSWMWRSQRRLRKVVVIFEEEEFGYRVSRWDMEV